MRAWPHSCSGSGRSRLSGFLNVHNNPNAGPVDVVHDLDKPVAIRRRIPVSAHRLRHTGATAGARPKMALDDIRKKLGHTTTKATVGYIHLAEQLPSPDDQPSGLDFLNITLPKAKRGPRAL
jgi:integrase